MGLHRAQTADGAYATCWVALDLVTAERLSTVLDSQCILGHPHGDLCSGEPLFGVEPEALEDEVAEAIEGARVAGRKERPGEILFPIAWRPDPREDFGRRPSAFLAVLVGVVLLDVVVVHPSIVLFEQPAPVLGSLEVVVGHPPLDAPGGFEVALPGLSLLDLQLADAKAR